MTLFASPRPRVDIYAKIHKALRAQMGAAIGACARLDPDDDEDVATLLDLVGALLGACTKHLELENAHVHPAMEARRTGSSGAVATEHVHHEEDIARLRALAQALRDAAPDQRTRPAASLHTALCLFAADNFAHMAREEKEHNAVLWQTCTDAELLALEAGIVASMAPEQKAASLRWMLPAISHAERLGMLAGMRASAPAPAFAAALDLARRELRPKDWEKLARALDVPA